MSIWFLFIVNLLFLSVLRLCFSLPYARIIITLPRSLSFPSFLNLHFLSLSRLCISFILSLSLTFNLSLSLSRSFPQNTPFLLSIFLLPSTYHSIISPLYSSLYIYIPSFFRPDTTTVYTHERTLSLSLSYSVSLISHLNGNTLTGLILCGQRSRTKRCLQCSMFHSKLLELVLVYLTFKDGEI